MLRIGGYAEMSPLVLALSEAGGHHNCVATSEPLFSRLMRFSRIRESISGKLGYEQRTMYSLFLAQPVVGRG